MADAGDTPAAVRRVLVALDASRPSLDAMKAAAWLAAELDAELHGLFVEDVDLLRGASIPFVREMGSFSGNVRALDARAVERQMRAVANEARRALAACAAAAGLRWSFEVVRGSVALTILEQARSAALVSLGVAPTAQRRLGRNVRRVIAESRVSLLLLRSGPAPQPTVAAVHDGSDGARAALELAARLARRRGTALHVLALGRTAKSAAKRRDEAAAWLGGEDLDVTVKELSHGDGPRLCQAAREAGAGWMIVAADSPLASDEKARELIHEIGCPLLLVRGES